VFGFQNTKFKLAEVATESRIGRVFVDDCVARHIRGELDIATVAMAKWWTTERAMVALDDCLQLHGGYGYMTEYPIARMWADNRVQKIYAGTNEIMKEIIARTL
jgi:acyl-CoA dehydrogenase